MPDNASRILVGRFGAPHGVRGEIRVKSFTGEPMALARYRGLTDADGKRAFRIESARFVKDDMIVVRIEGVRDRDAAQALTNTDIHMPREALPPPDEEEFYVADLVGMRAETADGALFGRIADVLNYGAGDILEIATEAGETRLVPFTRACAPHVDMAGGRVVVAPPIEVEGEPEDARAPG
jgi:16S rRNA processing protein RimM